MSYMDKKLLDKFNTYIDEQKVNSWADIASLLNNITQKTFSPSCYTAEEFDELITSGISFLTFEFGIDGVSIEMAKYAKVLEDVFSTQTKKLPVSFIGGEFKPEAKSVLDDHWERLEIEGFNGWSKWGDGTIFRKLYHDPMPEDSRRSKTASQEVWRQAVEFSKQLAEYFIKNDIHCIIPVNILSNPGNLSSALAICIVSEFLGLYVISSNHDFYWEGGKIRLERKPYEGKGVRDHFFTNHDNTPFWEVFSKVYPWQGRRWIQVNINTLQSKTLVKKFGFRRNRVFELGTSIDDSFFEDYDTNEVSSLREKMQLIFANGEDKLRTTSYSKFLEDLEGWMENQKPIFVGAKEGIEVDLSSKDIVYCLQPTRVIARKRIELDLKLFNGLMNFVPFWLKYNENNDLKLLLHITGPVPIEHEVDLQRILKEFKATIKNLKGGVENRVFLALSVGNEYHPAFEEKGWEPLRISDLYRLANAILFPSETEGRGLPIIESSAVGVPIVCNKYYPESVFEEVVGEDLSEEEKIYYINFPEGDFTLDFLAELYSVIFEKEKYNGFIEHNKRAVRMRYSQEMVQKKFEGFMNTLQALD